jgi:hypothetical protein
MARVMSLWLAVSLAIGVGVAGAQGTGGTGPRLDTATGTVKAVSRSSLTLEGGSGEVVVLGADSSTRFIGRGMASDLLLRKGRPRLSDVIKTGDRVTVSCRRSGRKLFAVEIRVVQS